jgi:hypothetical protein
MLAVAATSLMLLTGARAVPVRLEWDAPRECPGHDEVVGAIEAAIAGAPPREGAIDVRVQVTASHEGLVALLSVRAPWGNSERVVEAHDCAEIVRTTVLVAAIAADAIGTSDDDDQDAATDDDEQDVATDDHTGASAVEGPTTPPLGPRTTLEMPPAPEVDDVEVAPPATDATAGSARVSIPTTTTRAARGWQGSARLDGSFGLGVVPGPGGGAGLAVGAARRRVAFGLAATWWFATRTARTASGAYASVRILAVAPFVCGHVPIGPLAMGACGELELGGVRGVGHDVRGQQQRTQPWVAIAAGPSLRWAFARRFAVQLDVECLVVPYRAHFVIANEGTLYRAWPAAFRTRLGLEARFP